jgi:hypothetical protein
MLYVHHGKRRKRKAALMVENGNLIINNLLSRDLAIFI